MTVSIGVPPRPGEYASISGDQAPGGRHMWLHVTGCQAGPVDGYGFVTGTCLGQTAEVRVLVRLAILPVRTAPPEVTVS